VASGLQTEEVLAGLDLGYVARDLKERGLLAPCPMPQGKP